MKLQIIHLSDIHIKENTDLKEMHIEEMIPAINQSDNADECVIVISGDLAFSGKYKEYLNLKNMIKNLIISLQKIYNNKINIVCAPGNHDIDFDKINRSLDKEQEIKILQSAFQNGTIESIISNDLSGMNEYFSFCNSYECFTEDKIVSKKILKFDSLNIGFVMLNTAPLSLLGGSSIDMGMHYFSDQQINDIATATDADINVLVMHHSIEWFYPSCKNQLRDVISKNYTLILTGHEHKTVGETRNINKIGSIQLVQGNALNDKYADENGFCIVTMNLHLNKISGYSAVWKNDFYKLENIFSDNIKKTFHGLIRNTPDFYSELIYDDNQRIIDQYFVFPSMSYNLMGDTTTYEIETEDNLWNLVKKHNKIYVYGDVKSGKTVLAKRMYLKFIKEKKIPIYLSATEMENKNINKIIKYAFNDQYMSENNEYDKFLQLPIDKKILIIDEAEKINDKSLRNLLSKISDIFSNILIFGEDKLNLNIKNQVINALINTMTIQVSIKPFWYAKRKLLIENILKMLNVNIEVIPIEVQKINELINLQLKYFNLDPEFIIKFVIQYEKEYNLFSSSKNVFNMVYETSIKSTIIKYSQENSIAPELISNIISEIAYYMHFNKKRIISSTDIGKIIEDYKIRYRQKIGLKTFLDIIIKSKIMLENDDHYRFKDHTLTAYFVAQSLNQKVHQDFDITKNIESLLQNLCFSINGDIILFLALITNNPKFVYYIVEGAQKHFQNQRELSFDDENIQFITNMSLPVKNSLPNEKEINKHEKLLTQQEEKEKFSDLIELVDEYNYTEEDLNDFKNQVLISFKYIKILSQALPAFCSNIPASKQDDIVALIYKCPNQILFYILDEINNVFDEYSKSLFNEISELKRENNEININLEKVKEMIENVSSVLSLGIYQMVARTTTSPQTILALDSFNYEKNSNYLLQNFMIHSRIDNIKDFLKLAIEIDKRLHKKIEKAFIKYTVRDYILRNSNIFAIHGEGDALISKFFKKTETQNEMRKQLLKKRVMKIQK